MILFLLTLAGSLITSFTGSFLCFVIWVHFDFDERWRGRQERNRLKDIQSGYDLENERRMRHGQEPLPPLGHDDAIVRTLQENWPGM